MRGDLVSVIMPVYNVAPYVGAAIRSVLEQTHRDFELLAVDDGSTDGSMEVIESFKDARIRAFRLELNQGVAAARNRAMAEARGSVLALLDGDDMMEPWRLERQLAYLQYHPEMALCGAWCRTVLPDGSPGNYIAEVRIDPRAVNASLVFGNVFCTSSITVRREALPPDGFRQRYGEDYDFLVRVAQRHRLGILRDVLVAYRLRPGSAMRTYALEIKNRDVWDSQVPLFAALRIEPSAEEKRIHLFARTNGGNVDPAQLLAIRRWYEKLVIANRRAGCYPDRDFRLAASYMWFQQLFRATGCGLHALRNCFGSPLSYVHAQPWSMHARFLAKSAMGMAFERI